MSKTDLLANIKDAIINGEPLDSILLKCQLLSHQIKLPILNDWVNHELNGYFGVDNIPEYRCIRVTNVAAIFKNRWGISIAQDIPFGLDIPEPFNSRLYYTYLPNSVSELEDFAHKSKEDPKYKLTLNLHGSFYPVLENCFESADGTHYSIQKARQEFAGQSVIGVLTSIRSKILEFVCQLGEVCDCDLTPIDKMNNNPVQIFNSTIYALNSGSGAINNNGNNVAIGSGATITLSESQKAQLTELWEQINNLKSQFDDEANELAEYLVELKQEIDNKVSCPSAIRKTLRAIRTIIGKAGEMVIANRLDELINNFLNI